MKSAPLLSLAIAALACIPFDSLAAEALPVPSAAEAVPRGLQYLTEKGNDWMEDRKCASCHHLPMMIWSLREAGATGFAIDEKAFAKALAWAFDPKRDGDTFSTSKEAGGDYVREAAALLALSAAGTGQAPPAWSAKMIANAISSQDATGSWTQFPRNTRPPISPGAGTDLTLFVATALAVQPSLKTDPTAGTALEKALQWVASQPPNDETQPHALRLLLDFTLSRPPNQPSIAWLRDRQQADGGWSQFPDTPSDAYATGQAVCALRAADVPPTDPAIQRALVFLLGTQVADGSWRMTSRPTTSSKTGASNLEPITYAATAWAVMALARSGISPPPP
jgi:hypothetical protein